MRIALTLFGPPAALRQAARAIGAQAVLERLAVRAVADDAPLPQPGAIDAGAGALAVAAATEAVLACQAGEFDAVVAGPHHETAIARAGIEFSGYPGLLARVCRVPEDSVFLLLVGGGLRIVHATLHLSVAEALARLTPELVAAAARAGAHACAALGLPASRIGLFGINPHASEGGLFGADDGRCTAVAASRLRAEGYAVTGPQGADTLLADRSCDLYVAMLHDQGHIPVKLLAPQAASAISVGAGVLLASTGHGSAMDIAGRGVARPDALLRSLRLLAALPEPAKP
ncbi:MAG: 4-hydroxythreonine-4-phosphate dehydrogenase PdxA [Burkholderiales bacterium]|nr:4-hydroxythreonine-4-phosphate dehydrogenase PdxA [Burkholderiales bacterium]